MKVFNYARVSLAMLVLLLSLASVVAPTTTSAAPYSTPINHIVVFYMENHSFDNMYGAFPGANGLSNATNAALQVDKTGKTYDALPQVINTNLKPAGPDTRFPATLANKPFSIDQYMANNQNTGDLVHRFYQEQVQIDGGKMDKFAAISDAAGLTMGYYDGSKLPMWKYAQDYTLSDNFFHGAFGGSFLNHFWLVCACSPKYDNAPASLVAQVDASGNMTKDGAVTPDGYAVNTIQSAQIPHSPTITNTALLLPAQTMNTIGDRLDDKNISWAWYAGGWNNAVAGKAGATFQYHHQPFAYFKQFGNDTDARKQHLKDETDMVKDIQTGNLPAVTFWKPYGDDNEHPGYTDVLEGDQYAADMIKLIQQSPAWKDTAIIVTYDENGGSWDHVAPPTVDKWGPGTRIPTIIISPYAKKSYVDHTEYDTTSILKFIETRYGLQSLTDRDAKANDLNNAFDFSQPTGQGGAAAPGAGQGSAAPVGAPATGQGGSQPIDSGIALRWIAGLVAVGSLSYYGLTIARRRKNTK